MNILINSKLISVSSSDNLVYLAVLYKINSDTLVQQVSSFFEECFGGRANVGIIWFGNRSRP